MSAIPYWCRTVRIYAIFKAQEHYFRNKTKPDNDWFKWIKEPFMVKVSALVLAGLTVLSILLFVLCVVKQEVAIYLPSYSVYMCFMNGICSTDEPKHTAA
jgi:hypothetical protein